MELMEATKKFRFAGCNLMPGDRFYARASMAATLRKLRRARPATEAVYERRDMRPMEVSVLDDLRARYETKAGRKPDGRWKEARLRSEIG